jgi:organic radical activating enzyme
MNSEARQNGPCLLSVNEIFCSIQGESLHAGRPCVFVRLTGCNLRCTYCDTQYAYFQGTNMDVEQIISAAAQYGIALVEITGGEPLMQAGTPILAQRLLSAGFEVMVETNGTFPIDRIPVLMSPAEGTISPADAAAWILEDRLDVRLHLQLHKIVWPHIERGV